MMYIIHSLNITIHLYVYLYFDADPDMHLATHRLPTM